MAWDAAKPAGTTKIRLSDEEIRANWAALELQLDGSGANTGDHDFGTGKSGEHLQIKFHAPLAAAPGHLANIGWLYTMDVATKAELHYTDEDGNDIQLTKGGAAQAFPAGTKMLFYQDTAPTGWTIDAVSNDKLVCVTKGSGAGGEVGGAAHSTGTWTQPNHSHSHNHQWHDYTDVNTHWKSYDAAGNSTDPTIGSYTGGFRRIVIGGAAESGIKADLYTNLDATAGATANTWRPAAYNFIICTKD